MKTVTILNLNPSNVSVILDHESVCIGGGKCYCKGGRPATLHLPSGIAVKNLPIAYTYSYMLKVATNIQITPTPTAEGSGETRGKVKAIASGKGKDKKKKQKNTARDK